MSLQPIRLAILGLGKIAQDQHLPAINADPRFELVATVDPVSGDLGVAPHFETFQDMLAHCDGIDAVAICTPPQARHDMARLAIDKGLAVLLEKPPCATVSEAEALVALAALKGVTLFAAWHSRYAATVALAREWLAERKVLNTAIIWKEDVRIWHPGQAWIWQAGGFGMFDPGINALSIATSILPGPLCVQSGRIAIPANCGAPVSADIVMRDGNGAALSVDLDFLQTGPPTWNIQVDTDAGVLLLSQGGAQLRLPDKTILGQDLEYPAIYARFADLLQSGQSDADIAPLRLVADAFMRCQIVLAPDFTE